MPTICETPAAVSEHHAAATTAATTPPPPRQQLLPRPPLADGAQALLRHMDLFMYVLYSNDQVFVLDMVDKVTREVSAKYGHPPLAALLRHRDKPLLHRALFFLMVNFHASFRHWAVTADVGLMPVCPYKATRFLVALKRELVPNFLVDERKRLEEFERELKVTYIAS